LNAIILSQYLFIFWLKNLAAYNDDFWSLYFDLWATLFTWIAQGLSMSECVCERSEKRRERQKQRVRNKEREREKKIPREIMRNRQT